MKRILYISLVFLIVACNSTIKTVDIIPTETNQDSTQIVYTYDSLKVETYGDSLKVEFVYVGDTVYQHRIDIKGIEDDGFNSTFTIMSTFSTKKSTKLNCTDTLIIIWDSLEFMFCYSNIISEYYSLVSEYDDSYDKRIIYDIITELENSIECNNGRLVKQEPYLLFKIFLNEDYQALDLKTNDTISEIIIEKFETDFSGGRNFYLINKTNDTIGCVPITYWMR